jgi:hypothetical protein
LYETTEATFNLRFENTGTVHVRPVGDIRIFNMWGKERGVIPVNQGTAFGNVLPKSIRQYDFRWSGDFSPFDIGRYRAVVTLGYGSEVTRTTNAATYFWVVPVVPVALTLGGILFFILSSVYVIRRYIRNVLIIEQRRLGIVHPPTGTRRVERNHGSVYTRIIRFRIGVALLLYVGVSVGLFVWYFGEALVSTRSYTVEELRVDGGVGDTIPEND